MFATINNWSRFIRLRSRRVFAVGFFVLLLISYFLHDKRGLNQFPKSPTSSEPSRSSESRPRPDDETAYKNLKPVYVNYDKVHILIPATQGDINLCKTLLGLKILGYPTPTLISWGEDFHDENEMAGGTHIGKISGVLNFLSTLPPLSDNDLVIVMDAYDIVPQYPPSVLISRYRNIIARGLQPFFDLPNGVQTAATHRFFSSIVFGAGKKCAPNELHTVACYPLPDSPLPHDLYGSHTDTRLGRNDRSSARQRFLNSGYIIGPVFDLRRLFGKTNLLAQATPDLNPLDGGYGKMNYRYHGSDQSLFAEILGLQEWAREALRVGLKIDRSAVSSEPDLRVVRTTPNLPVFITDLKPRELSLFELRAESVLRPSFPHEEMNLDAYEFDPRQFEFGITLDYWSDIGQQTVNAEDDYRWLEYDKRTPSGEIVPPAAQIRGWLPFDCKLNLLDRVPQDIMESHNPSSKNWTELPLFTNICLGTLPVFLHHNGLKQNRELQWNQTWWQPMAKPLLAQAAKVAFVGEFLEKQSREDDNHQRVREMEEYREFRTAPKIQLEALAWTDKGQMMLWRDTCLPEWDREIFRDIPVESI